MEIDPELRRNVKKYFTFSKREYQASLLIFLFAVTCHYYADIRSYFFPPHYDMEKIRQEAALFSSLNYNEEDTGSAVSQDGKDDTASALSYFDPNSTTEDEWLKLGLTKKQAGIILNYISKGGKFKSSADLKKIYGIKPSEFTRLEPFIKIKLPEKNNSAESKIYDSAKNKKLMVELNSADSIALDRLPGIGFGFARRILKYRDALGGFYKVSQLLEVYAFRQSLFDSISPYLTVNASLIRPLHINTLGVDELKKHPYLRYRLASALVNYRDQHGPFQSADDLLKILVLDAATIEKLKPYLVMD
jgi:competence protein ComEA